MLDLLLNIRGIEVKENEPLSRHTTWRVGGPAGYFIVCNSMDGFKAVLETANRSEIPFMIIGKGSNLLVSDEGFPGIVLMLSGDFKKIEVDGSTIIAGCGCTLRSLSNMAVENSLSGLEFAHDIPGTLGAAIKINAGAYGWDFSKVTDTVTVIDSKNLQTRDIHPDFEYRSSSIGEGLICVSASLSLEKADPGTIKKTIDEFTRKRLSAQPRGSSAGSVFKNPPNDFAARLIESAGCKGLSVNGASVSQQHANFIMNNDGAKAQDIVKLIQLVRQKVYNTTGVLLDTEIKTVGLVLDESQEFREQAQRT